MKISSHILTVLTLVAAAGAAAAGPLHVYDGVEGDMINGDGISKDNFTQASGAALAGGGTLYVSLKARDRDTGEPTSQSGNRYVVDRGYSTLSPSEPNLFFDYQFAPGDGDDTDYTLRLSVDFDPGYGSTDFATLGGSISNLWSSTDGYFTTDTEGHGGTNAWSDSGVPYVVNNSWQLGYGFWAGLNPDATNYDPNAPGEYEIDFAVLDSNGGEIASTTAFAIVTPEPGALGMFGFALLTLGVMFRKRRNRR